jgi:hypothetical protein
VRVSDLDGGEMVDAISKAIYPIVFAGIGSQPTPRAVRERMHLNAEVMGRIMGVLLCGDEVGQEVFEMIDRCVMRMKAGHDESLGELLGPGGQLSRP